LVSGGSCLIVYGLRDGLLIVDDTGLHLRETFRSRHIPWDAVRSFRVTAAGKGVWPQAILRTKKVTMGIGDAGEREARRIVAELTEALREHTESADAPGDGQAPEGAAIGHDPSWAILAKVTWQG
jgi:hypothetical protein